MQANSPARPIKKSRSFGKEENIRMRWALRAVDRLPRRERFIKALIQLDNTVSATRAALEVLVKMKSSQKSDLVIKEFVDSVKSNMASNLDLFITDASFRGLGPVQVKSAEVFKKKILEATNASELILALKYFDSTSCMLKLPTQ